MEVKTEVLGTETEEINGDFVQVRTISINRKQFKFAPLFGGQVNAFFAPDHTARPGFESVWKTVANAILNARQRPADADVAALRDAEVETLGNRLHIPELTAFHNAVLEFSGLKAASGEVPAAG